MAALIAARTPDGPLPNLTGPEGVGRRTVTAAAAEMLGLSPIELPLQRLLTERIFQTPIELFVETMLAAAANMADTELLVVGEAELIAPLGMPHRRQVLTELGRLRSVVLLSDFTHYRTDELPETAQLVCGGRGGTGDDLACGEDRRRGDHPRPAAVLRPPGAVAAGPVVVIDSQDTFTR